jgi:outer membrane protein TolC
LRYIAAIMLLSSAALATTLREAVTEALLNRGDVQAAWISVESASWSRRGADLWFLPSVSGSIGFQRFSDVQEISVPGMGSIPMGSEYASQIGLSATVPLFSAMGPAGASLSREAEGLARSTAFSTQQDAVLQVVQAFYGVLLAGRMAEVSEEALSIAEQGWIIARQKFDAGMISRFELLQSQVAYENRIPDAISARNALQNSRAGLAVAMGLPDSAAVLPEGTLEDPLPVELPQTLEEARTMMLENSPDLGVASGLWGMGRAGVDMAGASFAPSLILQTNYDYAASRDDWHFQTDDYSRSWNTMIALSIPIFSGLGDFAAYNSARADMLASEFQAGALEQATGLQLVQAWNDLGEARERVTATTATASQAEEGSQIARVSYEAGVITRLEMDQALLALTAARTNTATALFALRAAEAKLARTMGILELE